MNCSSAEQAFMAVQVLVIEIDDKNGQRRGDRVPVPTDTEYRWHLGWLSVGTMSRAGAATKGSPAGSGPPILGRWPAYALNS